MKDLGNRRRIMIINWRWNFIDTALNDKLLNKEYPELKDDITSGKDTFSHEYKVIRTENDFDDEDFEATIESSLTGDLVVAIHIYKGKATKDLLSQLVDLYDDGNTDIYLMLHRGEMYDHDDVKELLYDIEPITKCFLFAFGRDFIYQDTKHEGLIDDAGNFYSGWVEPEVGEIEYIQVADDNRKLVKAKHFDRVWKYYQHEFKRKVTKLETLLISECIKAFKSYGNDSITKTELITYLDNPREKNSSFIYTRLKSFLGYYDKVNKSDYDNASPLEEELEELAIYEKQKEESYLFDDTRVNLKHFENDNEETISKQYDKVVQTMSPIFINDPRYKKETITRADIDKVSLVLEGLNNLIPGEDA